MSLWYAVKDGHFEIVQLLVQSGAVVNAVDSETGRTPIMFSAIQDRLDLTQVLSMQPQTHVNHCHNNVCTALLYVVQNGH